MTTDNLMDKEVQRRIYIEAIETFGQRPQETVAVEEMAELIHSLTKIWRNDLWASANSADLICNLMEEIADVEIMLEQLKLIYSIDLGVEREKVKKLLRLQRLIKIYQDNQAAKGEK